MTSIEVKERSNAVLARVLLVEDSAGDASLIMSALSEPKELFEVQLVSSIEAASVELLGSQYDCLLVDLGLPDGDGLAVVDAIREMARDTALVVLTGRNDEELGIQAIQHSADDYFLKSELSARGLQRSINYAIERTRAKVTLGQLVTRSSGVMAALGDGLVVLDSEGRVVLANPVAERILGVASSELVGLLISELPCTFIHRDGTPLVEGELTAERTLISGEAIRNAVTGVCRTDEGLSWVEINTHPLRSMDHRVDGVVISICDVTGRLAAEEAVRFQAALLGTVGQAVIATDSRGVILYWNGAAETTFGWSAAEVLNRPATEFMGADGFAHAEAVMAAINAGMNWSGDFLMLRRDGSTFPALLTNTPMFDDSGQLLAIIGVSVDISERKLAEETARQLSLVVDSTADGIITIGLDGTILTWNRGAQDLYGYAAEEALGRSVAMLDTGEPDEARVAAMTIIGGGQSIRDYELRRRRRDGSVVDVSLTGSPIYGEDGAICGIASIGRDVSDRKRLERQLSHQAVHDFLTGLPNRVLLGDRLSQALAGAARRNSSVSVLFLDLDQFKTVNDAHGHLVGDNLLVEVAERLKLVTKPADTLARFGGDEFVVVCNDADVDEAQCVADRLAAALKDPFEVGGHLQFVTASVGIAVSTPLEVDPDALLRYADAAMYDAKAGGRARSRVFDASLATKSEDKMALTRDLREALRMGAFEVHYQPVLELATGRVLGLEALTRWHHPVRGWIAPSLFVSIAEESGFIAEFDQWVLKRACRDGAELRAQGLLPQDAILSVNISARNVSDLRLVDIVREAAVTAGFPLETLELEITETAVMTGMATIREVLEGVRRLGVGIALDDFGTGYSSLTLVRQLPVTTIKIDLSFIRNVANQRDDRAICATVVDLARAMGLRTIAEGVENLEQLSLLHRMGCDAGQGYLWSWAMNLKTLKIRLGEDPHDFVCADKRPRWRSGHDSARSVQKQLRKSQRVA